MEEVCTLRLLHVREGVTSRLKLKLKLEVFIVET